MIFRLFATVVLFAACLESSCATAESFADVTFCQLAKDPEAFSGKRVRIRAIYSYMFEISSLRPPECCPIREALVWVDFDDEKARELLRQIPEGMGTVLAVFVGRIETGEVYGPNGERVRLVIDRIEKVEKKVRGNAKKTPPWIPQNCP
ncbi:MAG TPA: hypothetical protein VLC94_10600 [Candidatus Acidoferrum sp.]|nr:hypothetical protein [Candidatus Acidoferrum sp.]